MNNNEVIKVGDIVVLWEDKSKLNDGGCNLGNEIIPEENHHPYAGQAGTIIKLLPSGDLNVKMGDGMVIRCSRCRFSHKLPKEAPFNPKTGDEVTIRAIVGEVFDHSCRIDLVDWRGSSYNHMGCNFSSLTLVNRPVQPKKPVVLLTIGKDTIELSEDDADSLVKLYGKGQVS